MSIIDGISWFALMNMYYFEINQLFQANKYNNNLNENKDSTCWMFCIAIKIKNSIELNMKTVKFLIVLVSLIGLISCNNRAGKEISTLNVDRYIELLKANQYDSLNLPAFTYLDIPALLEYRNETQMITNFPRNGISSLYAPDCKLGMYVLWTIESIRAVAINSERLIMRFPSQNAILALKDSAVLSLVNDSISHEIAAKSYFDWWENNKQKNFSEFKNIDPLAGTNYKWH